MAYDKSLYLKGFAPSRQRRTGLAIWAGFVVAIVLVNYLVFFRGSDVVEPTLDQRLAKPAEAREEPPTDPSTPIPNAYAAPDGPATRMVEGVLAKGETATGALTRLGVAPSSAAGALAALSKHVDLKTLRAGQKVAVSLLPDNRVQSLDFPLSETAHVHVAAADGAFVAERREVPTDKEVVRFACMIRGSLFESLQRCGEDQALAPVLADLLAGQVDFFTDSRRGDVVRVAIEKESLAGRFLKYGRVHGLVYEGKLAEASVFPVDEGGSVAYYDQDGNNAEHAFLRSPLKYSRLSSDFSLHRLHPILHTYMPHRAQDYAAPKGTPVYAVGDGKVAFAGAQGPSGNLIVIDHAGGYQTYYAHLSHFAKGLKPGDRIERKTLIGYVGMTGRTTGPHLHFAVAKGGQFVHPRKLLNQAGQRLPKDREAEFRAAVQRALGELKALPVRGVDSSRS